MPKTKKSVTFNGLEDDSKSESGPEHVEKYVLSSPSVAVPLHALVVLVGMFSSGLTRDVKPVLIQGLATLMGLQLVYGYIVASNTQLAGSKSKKIKSENVVLLVGGAMVIALAASLPVFVVTVLMGAPMATHKVETLLYSAHVSVLALFPMFVFYRFEVDTISAVFSASNGVQLVLGNPILAGVVGAVLGTWIGVFPIPLDWDRDWQKWPITLLSGAYGGTVVAAVGAVAAGKIRGKRSA